MTDMRCTYTLAGISILFIFVIVLILLVLLICVSNKKIQVIKPVPPIFLPPQITPPVTPSITPPVSPHVTPPTSPLPIPAFQNIVLKNVTENVNYEQYINEGSTWSYTDDATYNCIIYAIKQFYITDDLKYKQYFKQGLQKIYETFKDYPKNMKLAIIYMNENYPALLPTSFMIYHILYPFDEDANVYLKFVYSELLKSPIQFLDFKTNLSFYTSVVWLYMHSVFDETEDYLNHEDLEVVHNFYTLRTDVLEPINNILYTDGGILSTYNSPYFKHVINRIYGFYYDLYTEFFTVSPESINEIKSSISNFIHPQTKNINPSFMGITGEMLSDEIYTFLEPNMNHKIVSMPSVGWFAYKSTKFHFMVRCMKSKVSYIEGDSKNVNGALIWAYSRELMYFDLDYTKDFTTLKKPFNFASGVFSQADGETFDLNLDPQLISQTNQFGVMFSVVLDDKLYIFSKSRLSTTNDVYSFQKYEIICVDDNGVTIYVGLRAILYDLHYTIHGSGSKLCKIDYLSENVTLDNDNLLITKPDDINTLVEFAWHQGFSTKIPKITRLTDFNDVNSSICKFTIDNVSFVTDANTYLRGQRGSDIVFGTNQIGADKTFIEDGIIYKRDPYHYTFYKDSNFF